jgi:hypothetical protein
MMVCAAFLCDLEVECAQPVLKSGEETFPVRTGKSTCDP